jgi:hypothetical protein
VDFITTRLNMGHIILSLELLESLKDFDTWKEFKNNPDFFEDKDVKYIENKKQVHFNDPWDNFSGTHFGY